MLTILRNNPNKPQKIRNKGFIRGQYIQSFAALPASIAGVGILKGMRKISEISENDSVNLLTAAKKGLSETGLSKKGVEIFQMNEAVVSKETKNEAIGKVVDLYKNIFQGEIDNIEGLIGGAIDSFKKVIPYNKKDKDALNALKEELLSNKRIKNSNDTINSLLSGIKEDENAPEFIKNFDYGEIMAKIQGVMFKQG